MVFVTSKSASLLHLMRAWVWLSTVFCFGLKFCFAVAEEVLACWAEGLMDRPWPPLAIIEVFNSFLNNLSHLSDGYLDLDRGIFFRGHHTKRNMIKIAYHQKALMFKLGRLNAPKRLMIERHHGLIFGNKPSWYLPNFIRYYTCNLRQQLRGVTRRPEETGIFP